MAQRGETEGGLCWGGLAREHMDAVMKAGA
jgi:hypothetical protein